MSAYSIVITAGSCYQGRIDWKVLILCKTCTNTCWVILDYYFTWAKLRRRKLIILGSYQFLRSHLRKLPILSLIRIITLIIFTSLNNFHLWHSPHWQKDVLPKCQKRKKGNQYVFLLFQIIQREKKWKPGNRWNICLKKINI